MKSIKSGDNELISEINVTPLVDVMLILMIIFLITAPLLVKNINVNLPKAGGSSPKTEKSVTISIKSDGILFYEGKSITHDNLTHEISKIAAQIDGDNKVTVKIAADKDSKYQDLAKILGLLNEKRINNVKFLSKQ